ncbi:MAG TPA: AmmeMemoRadiSam system protein B [Acidobacteriota bacterium]|nr:AmmeMemoRadiSam system protein B [Acidobacteriota bacterium]
MTRKPFVAGQFYPGQPRELREMLNLMTDPAAAKAEAIAVVSPHAGYVYSGAVAGAVFSSVAVPDTVLILGPGHRPIRPVFAVQSEGSWETPLGAAPIESRLAKALLKACPACRSDAKAHEQEHSLEVQVPFLQHFNPDVSIVPVCISHAASYADLDGLGRAVAEAVRGFGRAVLIVASTDMSHYVSRGEAKEKDGLAIDRILALDPEGLFRTVLGEDISMCGFQPVTAALVAARDLGAVKAELVSYATSGDVTGDDRGVVGYAGLRIL